MTKGRGRERKVRGAKGGRFKLNRAWKYRTEGADAAVLVTLVE